MRAFRAVFHILFGALLCAVAFPLMSVRGRERCVGWWSRRLLTVLGIRLQVEGQLSSSAVLIAANHVSWIDIVALNSLRALRFVSKAEVRHWPLIGWMAACGGTLFIERARRRDAMRVVHAIADALSAGQTVAVFPEGTVGDGTRLLPFHANLLQAAIASGTPVQPVALRYTDAFSGASSGVSRAVAYEGDITIVQSALKVLLAERLVVTVKVTPVIAFARGRRELAVAVEEAVRRALEPPVGHG